MAVFDEKSMGIFLHELKTPLAIMRTHLESELGNEAIPLDVRRKLVMDVEEIARLNHLIGEMRTLVSGDSSELKLNFKQESLIALLVDVVELLEPLAGEKEQKLTFVVTQNITLNMNREKVMQLFYNLIHNAIKYTPCEGEIEVDCTQYDDEIVVSVKDSGQGITINEQQAIFDIFYRAKNRSSIK